MQKQIQAVQVLYWQVINLLKSILSVNPESLNCTTLHKALRERVPYAIAAAPDLSLHTQSTLDGCSCKSHGMTNSNTNIYLLGIRS